MLFPRKGDAGGFIQMPLFLPILFLLPLCMGLFA